MDFGELEQFPSYFVEQRLPYGQILQIADLK